MRITVLGATGGMGSAIVSELAARGHQVRAASRSVAERAWPTGVEVRPTDLTDPIQAAAACADAEVVVMAAQVPYSGWAEHLTPMVDAAVDAAAGAGARLVMVDNLYAYGSPGTPLTERTPEAATTRKGRLRAAIGERLLAAHRSGRVAVSIGRFSDHYGPGGSNSLVQQVMVGPAVAGRRPRVFIDGTQPHTFHFLPDAARGFATLVEHPEADGAVWILPAAPPVTQQELADLLGELTDNPRRAGRISPAMLWMVGLVNRELREAREVVAQFDRPYTTDASAFEAAFGPIEVTPHREALAATVAWTRRDRVDAPAD